MSDSAKPEFSADQGLAAEPAADAEGASSTGDRSSPEDPSDADDHSFSELLEQYESGRQQAAEQPDGVLRGTVVSLRDDGVFVDIGRKSEAFLPIERPPDGSEDHGEDDLKVGDQIEVSITGRSPDGYLTLSRVIAERPRNWAQFEAAYAEGTPIAGKVTEVIKGGLSVDVGVRAFMPHSRSGAREAEELEALVGQEIRCRIVQLDVEDENVIVDRRVLLEEEREQQRQEAIARLEPGAVVKGTVRNIREFGAFVDLGGVDGLLHVSDIAWSKINDVSSVLSEGQELQVKILKVEEDGKRISVGLKQLSPDPWTLIGEKLQAGDRIKGTVTRLKDFGAFVEIEPGVDGLVHVSEMSWARRVRHPRDLVKEGDVVDAVVLELKPEERRIGLGIKQTLGDPWERAEKELAPGTTVEGTVRNLAKFGAFVEVLEGVEGLIHVSDITAEKRLNHPSEVLQSGQTVKAVVLELDREQRRLKLGMKQLEPDDLDHFIESSKPGDTVTGRVSRISGRTAYVELGEGVEGVCKLQEARAAPASAQTAAKTKDVSALGEMLQAAWKSGSGGGSASPGAQTTGLKAGEVRSFRVTRLDEKSRTVELALADAPS